MPKRLSDITHQYERSAEELESAEDEMTRAVERARELVGATSRHHRTVAAELLAYLREHPDEIVIANDHGYHYDPHVPGSIRRRPIYWAHHVWVEDREGVQPATYRVPINDAGDTVLRSLADKWDDAEPDDELAAIDCNPGAI